MPTVLFTVTEYKTLSVSEVKRLFCVDAPFAETSTNPVAVQTIEANEKMSPSQKLEMLLTTFGAAPADCVTVEKFRTFSIPLCAPVPPSPAPIVGGAPARGVLMEPI